MLNSTLRLVISRAQIRTPFATLSIPNRQKLGLAINDEVTLKEVTKVYADHVVDQIRELVPDITIFKQEEGESFQDALKRFDSLKVPFAVCLDENLTTRAVVGLRMRNTKLCEEVHSTHLPQKVFLYLKHLPPSLVGDQ